MKNSLIKKYKEFLPSIDEKYIVSLNEGNTPLIPSVRLSKVIFNNRFELYFKFEGLNPTGSFKDRGMTLAISKALEKNSKAIICASTGNTSASAAAYAARSGLKCIILIPNGKIAYGKLAQAIQFGAKILAIDGNFDLALDFVKSISKEYNITLVNSINPYRIEGQTTAAYEICDELKMAPDYQFMPVGNAGNITAYWLGYKRYKEHKKINNLPKMMGYQASGAAPLVLGKPVNNPETVATAIRIGNPASWQGAILARDESNGIIDCVTDEEIIDAYKLLSKYEGIFAELASCASLAGLIKYYNKNEIRKNSKVVCILTGNGLKDPDAVLKLNNSQIETIKDYNELVERMKFLNEN